MNKTQSQEVRGIAIILMLIHHLFTWNGAVYNSLIPIVLPKQMDIPIIAGVFGKLCVTIYLFLSGYGLYCKYGANNIAKVDLKDSLKKIISLYAKYWVVLVVFLPYGFVKGIFKISPVEFLINITAYGTTYNEECWFLLVYVLMIVCVLPFLVKYHKKLGSRFILLCSFLLIATGYAMRIAVFYSGVPEFAHTKLYFNLYYFSLSQFAFVAGWVCKDLRTFVHIGKLRIALWIEGIVFLTILVLKIYCPGGMLIDTLLTVPFIALCLKFINWCTASNKVIYILGKYSTYMWMTHTFYSKYYFSAYIYAVRYPILIILLLILVSLVTAKVLTIAEQFVFMRILKAKGGNMSIKMVLIKFREEVRNRVVCSRMRSNLKNKNFTFICSNCTGAIITHELQCKFYTPTVNLYMKPKDFIKFIANIEKYRGKTMMFNSDHSAECGYPVATLEDITIYFVHYHSEKEAVEKWSERFKRIEYSNIFFMMSERDECTYDDLKAFDKLSYKNKIVLTKKKYPEIKSSVYISGFEDKPELGDVFRMRKLFSLTRFYDEFDFVKWLNQGKSSNI